MTEPTGQLASEFVTSELLRCNRCGYCLSTCPTYRAMRTERYVARGRNELLRQACARENGIAPDLAEAASRCLLCGACTQACFGAVRTDELMLLVREALHQQGEQPRIQELIFRHLLPRPDRMDRLMRLLAAGKRSGLSTVARRLGLLRWISATLEGAEGLVQTMPRRFLRDRLGSMGFQREPTLAGTTWRLAPTGEPTARVLYFVGCGTNYQLPRQGEAAIRLLAAAGCQVFITQNVCCGLPPFSYGDRQAAKNLARSNVRLLTELSFDLVATECASCSGFIKKRWPALLAQDDLADAARSIASRCRDFTELVAEMHLPAPTNTPSTLVTYHDPCHLRRGQGIAELPRRLLVDVGGYSLRELPEADWCCGGAGSYNLAHPDLSLQILERKLDRIMTTGAATVATACPACVIQLAYGVRIAGVGLRVSHVSELLAESLGIPLGE